MNYFLQQYTSTLNKPRGFVLPFTLLICAIMLLLSVSISAILMKQIYFSNIARDSQSAYYAADDALACALSVEETYQDGTSGIFPYESSIVSTTENIEVMQARLEAINALRAAIDPPFTPLAAKIEDIKCAQSLIFDTTADLSDFTVETASFSWNGELGKTSSFNMKMDLGDGTFRCAKVTINKTASYKQIISQGYSRCDRTLGSVERAIIYSTVQ
jgi:hypothetical protein